MYTSGTSLIAQSHSHEDKGKVQGLAELIVACLAAFAAFSSGVLLDQFGWSHVNLGSIPLLTISVAITLHYKLKNLKLKHLR